MTNVALLISCILGGMILRRSDLFGEEGPSVLNRLIIYFFIPLIALYQIPKLAFELSLVWLTVSPFLVFGLSFLFFQLLAKPLHIDRPTKAALILTAGIGSTSFVGFPIFELLYGPKGLTYGIFLSLGGTILVFNTVGLSTLFYYSNGEANIWSTLKSVLTFVPFVSFLIAIVLNLIQFSFPPLMDELLAKLVAPFSVIALLSIGMQIDFRISKKLLKEILLGQLFKLFIAPLVIYILTWYLLGMHDTIGKVCILGAAIGSMNAMSILTAEKGLAPKLSILMPAIGIPISIPILFLIAYFLG